MLMTNRVERSMTERPADAVLSWSEQHEADLERWASRTKAAIRDQVEEARIAIEDAYGDAKVRVEHTDLKRLGLGDLVEDFVRMESAMRVAKRSTFYSDAFAEIARQMEALEGERAR